MVPDHSSTDSENEESGLQEAGRGWAGRDRAVVGQVKELVAGVSHQTALPLSLSLSLCGPCGCEEGGGERSPSVYLPPLLFDPLDWTRVEQRGVGMRGKNREEEETKWQKEREKMRRTETLHKLRMGDSVLMPSFTEEIAWEGEPLKELGGWQEG